MAERRLERLKGSGRHGTPGRARGRRARGGRRPAHPRGPRGRHADPRPGARRGREQGDPRVPVPDREAGPRPAQRRRGRPRRRAGASSSAIRAGYPHQHAMVEALSARIEMELGELEPDEAAVFMDELGITESRAGPGHRPVLPAARADLVPDRRARRGPRLADPGRLDRGRCRGCHPHRPRPRLHPGRDGRLRGPARPWGRWPRRGRPAGCARRARPTGSATATSSRSSSASSSRQAGRSPAAQFRRSAPGRGRRRSCW